MPFLKSAIRISGSSRGVLSMSVPRSNLARWLAAARPRTLPLTITPVIAGVGLAFYQTGQVAAITALMTLCAAVAIQVGTNLHNDASDYERGTDTAQRLGPPRATAQGWFSARQVKRAAHVAFALAFLMGLVLVVRGGWPILAIGMASLIGGYAYTGGPRPIAYGPFGEVHALLFFGVAAVAGTDYLQTLGFSWAAIALGIALGLPAAAVLLLNNYRDLETDRLAGRRTLCHYLGLARARWLYSGMLVAPVAILVISHGLATAWPVAAALPLAGLLIRRLWRGASGLQLNALLGQTALYQSALTILLLVGLGLGRLT